jgi:asparagine synthase (glutamine-hydrolysing)
MCGIVGSFGSELSLNALPLQSIRHRGPDDQGSYQYNKVLLGHTRLSILDLSANGHQPMTSADDQLVIVYNGEIYNHLDIRKELGETGYKSTSDTETLLFAYRKWGMGMLQKLNGIFAFALLDKSKQKLFVVRDHFGVKPLYYFRKNNTLLFGSELKALLEFPEFDRTVDYTALVNYLNFLWSPGEKTPFQFVRKLLPGYYMEIDLQQETIAAPVKYYEVPFNGQYTYKREDEALAALDAHLTNAVHRQMLSDVPLGFFLSGGLDSSAIVALAAKQQAADSLTCYTTDVKDNDFEGYANDLPYAKKVAAHLGVRLNVIPSRSDIVSDFDSMIYHLDEPQADPAPFHVLNICKAARQDGIKVMLGGAAGDDIFSGYRSHQALYYERYFKLIPPFACKGIKEMVSWLGTSNPMARRLRKLTANFDKTTVERMYGYAEWLPLTTNKGLFALERRHQIDAYQPADYYYQLLQQIPQEKNLLNQKLFWEMKGFLPDHNLNYTDKMSMAVGVESRVPFLDTELVAFSTQLHPDLKMKGTVTKYLLKKLMEKYLPHEIIYRPKTGFGGPVREWVKSDLKEKIADELSAENLRRRGIFDAAAVQQLIADNQSGKIDAAYSIWGLLAIESWFRQFVDQ